MQLLFFWLPTPETAIARVKRRVIEGGHNIPIDVIRRRYMAGIKNLFEIYMPIVDSWMLVENQSNPRIIIAENIGNGIEIHNETLYNKVKNYVS